jgi:hypothetical protein
VPRRWSAALCIDWKVGLPESTPSAEDIAGSSQKLVENAEHLSRKIGIFKVDADPDPADGAT